MESFGRKALYECANFLGREVEEKRATGEAGGERDSNPRYSGVQLAGDFCSSLRSRAVYLSSDLRKSPYDANSLRQLTSGYFSSGTLLKGRDQEASGTLAPLPPLQSEVRLPAA